MREHYFRGQEFYGEKYLYGDLFHDGERTLIAYDGGEFEVKPETVAQLIGYDSEGTAIYEGDKLIDDNGTEYTATVETQLIWENADGEKLPTSLFLVKRFSKIVVKGGEDKNDKSETY